ncbi:hypothetical protein [Marimonas lutisalis]|uniref:hypothetical protein n=1 Tax=Marimonas lutisalis TaxID=2545756 RepID=UPI0010F6CCF6|nr:hypothetical protein [Marimonas lutisalis]
MARIAAILAFMLALAGMAQAEERSSLWPDIPKASGTPHPEGNEYWRKQHMELMKHDRDETMYEGDRQVQASLKACFDCHAVEDETGTPVTYASDKHFCRVCHDYAAVKVDCFMCHRSTPDGVDEGSAHARLMSEPEGETGVKSLSAYLMGKAPKAAMRTNSQAETGE